MKKKTIGIIIWILFIIAGFCGLMFVSHKVMRWILWVAAVTLGYVIYSALKKKDGNKKE